jgi:hypothetical protein
VGRRHDKAVLVDHEALLAGAGRNPLLSVPTGEGKPIAELYEQLAG